MSNNNKNDKKREPLFPKECMKLLEKESYKCEPEGARAAFLISEDALNKLINRNEGGVSGPKTAKLFENQERDWRNRERCIDKLHAEKVGIDETSIRSMESTLKKLKESCGGSFDLENKPLLECYQANMISPLKCRALVLEYMQTVAKYREQVFGPREET